MVRKFVKKISAIMMAVAIISAGSIGTETITPTFANPTIVSAACDHIETSMITKDWYDFYLDGIIYRKRWQKLEYNRICAKCGYVFDRGLCRYRYRTESIEFIRGVLPVTVYGEWHYTYTFS